MSLLGIEHVERNGHHYYRGLSLWPEDWQTTLLAAHGDLYTRHAQGFTCLEVRAERLAYRLGECGALWASAVAGCRKLPATDDAVTLAGRRVRGVRSAGRFWLSIRERAR